MGSVGQRAAKLPAINFENGLTPVQLELGPSGSTRAGARRFRVGFALAKTAHLHRAYIVTACKRKSTTVYTGVARLCCFKVILV